MSWPDEAIQRWGEQSNPGYVVVIFGGPSGACELSHCPMHAIGPFRTSDEAKAAAADLPQWMQPHVLGVSATP